MWHLAYSEAIVPDECLLVCLIEQNTSNFCLTLKFTDSLNWGGQYELLYGKLNRLVKLFNQKFIELRTHVRHLFVGSVENALMNET